MKTGNTMLDFVVDENFMIGLPDAPRGCDTKELVFVRNVNTQSQYWRANSYIEQRLLNTLFCRAALLPVPEEDGRDNAQRCCEGRKQSGLETKSASGKIGELGHVVVGITMAQLSAGAM